MVTAPNDTGPFAIASAEGAPMMAVDLAVAWAECRHRYAAYAGAAKKLRGSRVNLGLALIELRRRIGWGTWRYELEQHGVNKNTAYRAMQDAFEFLQLPAEERAELLPSRDVREPLKLSHAGTTRSTDFTGVTGAEDTGEFELPPDVTIDMADDEDDELDGSENPPALVQPPPPPAPVLRLTAAAPAASVVGEEARARRPDVAGQIPMASLYAVLEGLRARLSGVLAAIEKGGVDAAAAAVIDQAARIFGLAMDSAGLSGSSSLSSAGALAQAGAPGSPLCPP